MTDRELIDNAIDALQAYRTITIESAVIARDVDDAMLIVARRIGALAPIHTLERSVLGSVDDIDAILRLYTEMRGAL